MSDAPPAEKTVHHVAVAVRDIEAALAFYRDKLGLEVEKRAVLPDQGAEVALLALANSRIELVQPLSNDGSLARFIERRGEGLHHICLTTPDIRAAMTALHDRGVETIETEPRTGIDGLVCFIHPREHAGVLVELVEVGS